MVEAFPLVKQADCVLVIGTSLQVYPAAQLAFEAAPGVPLHVIDPAADVLDVPNASVGLLCVSRVGAIECALVRLGLGAFAPWRALGACWD